MFGISGFELLIIVAFVLIIFGPDKIPDLARTVGKALGMFKKAQNEMEQLIRVEMMHDKTKDFLKPQNEALAKDDPQAVTPVEATEAATVAWSVTAEDDEEEEDEE